MLRSSNRTFLSIIICPQVQTLQGRRNKWRRTTTELLVLPQPYFSSCLTAAYWKQEMCSEEKSSIMSQKISSPSHSNSSSSSKHDSRQVSALRGECICIHRQWFILFALGQDKMHQRKAIGMWNVTVCFEVLHASIHERVYTCLFTSHVMPSVSRALHLKE